MFTPIKTLVFDTSVAGAGNAVASQNLATLFESLKLKKHDGIQPQLRLYAVGDAFMVKRGFDAASAVPSLTVTSGALADRNWPIPAGAIEYIEGITIPVDTLGTQANQLWLGAQSMNGLAGKLYVTIGYGSTG